MQLLSPIIANVYINHKINIFFLHFFISIAYIQNGQFIQQLCKLFKPLEESEDQNNLSALASIFHNIVFLNDVQIFQILFRKDIFETFAAILECICYYYYLFIYYVLQMILNTVIFIQIIVNLYKRKQILNKQFQLLMKIYWIVFIKTFEFNILEYINYLFI